MLATDKQIGSCDEKGLHAVGNGLYLNVWHKNSKSWILRYQVNGKRHKKGIGSYPEIGLARAKEIAIEYQAALASGNDPAALEKQKARDNLIAEKRQTSFKDVGDMFFESMKDQWAINPKTGKRTQMDFIKSQLDNHVYPTLGDVPIGEINGLLVIDCCRKFYSKIPVSGKRIIGNIAKIFKWAQGNGYYDIERQNPADWKGLLSGVFLTPTAIKPKVPHPSVPYTDVGELFDRLSEPARFDSSDRVRALIRFILLSCSRVSEARYARWQDVDFDAMVWERPVGNMKRRWAHTVPLTPQMVAILKAQKKGKPGDLIFPNRNDPEKPMQNRLAHHLETFFPEFDTDVHGFRATFRTWAAEVYHRDSAYDRDIIEMCLAHKVGDATEQSYQRGQLLEHRREVMRAWNDFVSPPTLNLVPSKDQEVA